MDDINEMDFPIVAIVKTPDDLFIAVKLMRVGDTWNAHQTEISVPKGDDDTVFNSLKLNEVMYSTMTFDFSYDENEGVSEFYILDVVEYETMCVYDVLVNDFERFIECYVDYIVTREN